MVMNGTSLLVAALEVDPYVDLVKIGIVVGLLLLWAMGAQWVDRDTNVVKARREQWNLIVVSGGAVATFVLLVVPFWTGSLFAVGLLFWILLAGGSMAGYIVHRNGRVVPNSRILTPGHFKRLLSGAKRGKQKDKGQRVQIADHKGNHVELSDDPEERKDYQAVQDFLFDLLWNRATEVDLSVAKENFRLIYKVDGVAESRPDGIPTEKGERIIRFLKNIGGLNVEEIRRPQKGHIEACLLSEENPPGKTEVRTSGTTAGERLRLKFDSGAKILKLAELGASEGRLKQLKELLGKKNGLLLIAAPSHHGRTTTQYAILKTHDAYMNNIHSLERRPLADIDNVTQQPFEGNSNDVNYARMLQTVLRREPDIVMVGECDDKETAQIAAQAAAESRKIYLGIDAKDSFDALTKYIDFLSRNKLAAKAIVGVLAQRLVRILCSECREAFQPDETTLKKLNLPVKKIEHFYRPPTEPKKTKLGKEVVCMTCRGTGYLGRTGVFELLVADEAVSALISEGASINKIKAQCRKNRMYYLQEEGLLKVIDGTTSMNEVLRCLRTGDS